MSSSRLDKVARISSNFNDSANVNLEKTVSQYQLTKEEQQERFDLGKTLVDNKKQELQNFKDPKEFKQRLDDKYAELAQKNQTPMPENFPPGMRSRTMPQHNLLLRAHAAVDMDHGERMKGFESDYNKGLNGILERAAQDGRGPQPPERSQSQDRSQDNDRTRDRD